MLGVVSLGRDDEAIVGVNISRFIDRMISRARAPGWIPPVRPGVGMVVVAEVLVVQWR